MYKFKEAFEKKRDNEKVKQRDVVEHEKYLINVAKNEVLWKYI